MTSSYVTASTAVALLIIACFQNIADYLHDFKLCHTKTLLTTNNCILYIYT